MLLNLSKLHKNISTGFLRRKFTKYFKSREKNQKINKFAHEPKLNGLLGEVLTANITILEKRDYGIFSIKNRINPINPRK